VKPLLFVMGRGMPEALLAPGEGVLLVTRRHVITLVIPLLLILTAGLLLLTQTCPIAVAVQLDGRCPLVVAALGVTAALPFVLDWFTTRFVLTNRRVIRLQRPIWLLVRSLDLSTIEGLSLRQGILGRLVGFGDVVIDSAATQGGRLVFDFVPDPEVVLNRIAAAVAAMERAGGGGAR
jgi:PH (Pleckstrin Homology) domain-containing protein